MIIFEIIFAPNTTYLPDKYSLNITDSTGAEVTGVTGVGTTETIPANLKVLIFWPVTTSGNYYFEMLRQSSLLSLRLVNYTITSSNGTQIAQYTDVIRNYLLKQVYFASSTTTTITFDTSAILYVVGMNTDYPNFSVDTFNPVGASTSNTTHATFTLSGYYLIFLISSMPGTLTY